MWDAISGWISDYALQILAVIAIAWLAEKLIQSLVVTVVKSTINRERYSSEREERLRERTIISLASAVVRISIVAIAAMVILTIVGVDLAALLAGAGIVGFTVGFGAQNLVKDFIAGVFIVLENQYRVGDIIKINNVGGRVVKLTTRITVLRDIEGNVHYIPNGSIAMATNMTMEYAKINLEITVSYDADLDKVKDIVNKIGLDLAKDDEWKDFITNAPYFARVSNLGETGATIKILGKVLPAKQWGVEGELRKRIKTEFDKHKITISHPQVTVHQAKTNSK